MTVYILKRKEETWREFIYRRAEDYGLEYEAVQTFDTAVANGASEADAAFSACSEWELLYYADEPTGRSIQTN